MRQIVFDTETTGLSPREGHRIIELGCVELVEGAPTGRTFHRYINPERAVDAGAAAVHGFTQDMLEHHPTFADPSVGPAFRDFIADADIVAHNASFDQGFVDAEFERMSLSPLDPERIIDTLRLARAKFPGANNSLDALCDRFGVSRKNRHLHGALLDARLLAEVYIELTGGRQRGLVFLDSAFSAVTSEADTTRAAGRRPGPRPVLITDAERDAHADFISDFDTETLWPKGMMGARDSDAAL